MKLLNKKRKITNKDISIKEIITILDNDPEYTELDLSHNMLDEEDIKALVDGLKKSKLHKVDTLYLNNCNIDAESAAIIATLRNIVKLHLNNNPIGDTGIIALAAMTHLCELRLNTTKMTEKSLAEIVKHRTITRLHIGGNLIGNAGASLLFANNILLELDVVSLLSKSKNDMWNNENSKGFISDNILVDLGRKLEANRKADRFKFLTDGRRVFCYPDKKEVVSHDAKISPSNKLNKLVRGNTLDLAKNRFIDAKGFGEFLEQHPEVTVLDLRNNNFTDGEISFLVEELKSNKTHRICTLNFSNCNINANGITKIATIPNITKLNLSNNPIEDKGVAMIAAMPALVELIVFGCGISSKGCNALSHHNSLFKLSISNNKIDDDGLIALSKIRTLLELNASNCGISSKGVEVVSAVSNITKLGISFNNIGDEGAIALLKNDRLIELDVINIPVPYYSNKLMVANYTSHISEESLVALNRWIIQNRDGFHQDNQQFHDSKYSVQPANKPKLNVKGFNIDEKQGPGLFKDQKREDAPGASCLDAVIEKIKGCAPCCFAKGVS